MKFRLILFVLLTSQASIAQQKKIKTLEVSDTIISAMIDRPGELYIVTKDGQIQRFDKDGKLMVLYKNKVVPTLFDPRDGARLFAYYRHNQEYDYLSPSFEITSAVRIDPAFAIEPWLIGPANDHRLWILDAADHSLKKVNPRASQVEIEVVIDSTIIRKAQTFTAIREYQGFVFLLDPAKGIYIFNSLGKHIRTLDVKGVRHFNFLGEELYFIDRQSIRFFDLFTAETRTMSLERKADFVLFSDERMMLIRGKTIDIYEFTP